MAGFGKGTDYFDLATELTNVNIIFIESSITPKPTNTETAQNADGNMAGIGDFDGGPADAVEVVYELQGGSLDIGKLILGHRTVDAVERIITAIDIETSNSSWPRIVCTGFTGVTDYANFPAFTLPTITINGKRQAQLLDFTVAEGCRLTSSKLSVSGELHHTLDDDGVVGAMAFTGAMAELSMEAVEIATVASWTLGGTWTETQAPGASNANVAWGTASGTAVKIIEPDVAP